MSTDMSPLGNETSSCSEAAPHPAGPGDLLLVHTPENRRPLWRRALVKWLARQGHDKLVIPEKGQRGLTSTEAEKTVTGGSAS